MTDEYAQKLSQGMTSQEYWAIRNAERRMVDAEKLGKTAIAKLVTVYKSSEQNIQKMTKEIYDRYSKASGIDPIELNKIITGSDRANFLSSVKTNMKNLGYDPTEVFDQGYLEGLTRLDAMQQQVYWEIAQIAPKEVNITGKAYAALINKTYQDNQKELGVTGTFSTIDKNGVNAILSEQWVGRNYRESVWGNVTEKMAASIPKIIGGAMVSGQSYQKTSQLIADRYNVHLWQATRLVRTESNFLANQAELETYKYNGYTKYQWVTIIDGRNGKCTCPEHNGLTFDVDKATAGENYPPLHPNCRCTTIAVLSSYVNPDIQAEDQVQPEPQQVVGAYQPNTTGGKKNTVAPQKAVTGDILNTKYQEAMAAQMNPNKAQHDYNAELNIITQTYKGPELTDRLTELMNRVPGTDPLRPAMETVAKLSGWQPSAQDLTNQNYLKLMKQPDTVAQTTEMVGIKTLDAMKEFDRAKQVDYKLSPIAAKAHLEELKQDIKVNGIKEPLILNYSTATKRAYLAEGNTRLAAAKSLGMSSLPVQVVRQNAPIYKGMNVKGFEPDKYGYVPANLKPSEIGVKVATDQPEHIEYKELSMNVEQAALQKEIAGQSRAEQIRLTQESVKGIAGEIGYKQTDLAKYDEQKALHEYVIGSYAKVNLNLRKPDAASPFAGPNGNMVDIIQPEALDRRTAPLDALIGRRTINENIMTFRGMPEELVKGLQPGDTFQDLAYTSVTLDRAVADEFGKNWVREVQAVEIQIPKGSHGAFVYREVLQNINQADINLGFQYEWEIILPRASIFKVINNENGRTTLQLQS